MKLSAWFRPILVSIALLTGEVGHAAVPSPTAWVQVTVTSLPQSIPVTFVFQNGSDLLVVDSKASPPTVLVQNSDFSVAGGNGSTGTITVVSNGSNAVKVGDVITVSRRVPITQTQSANPLTPQQVVAALDKAATISQQLNLLASRSLQFQIDESTNVVNGVLPLGQRKNAFLAFDNNGAPWFPTTASIVTAITNPVLADTVAALRAIPVTNVVNNSPCILGGYYVIGDGGGGNFIYSTASTATDNGGTVIKPASISGAGRWLRVYTPGVLSASWFGVRANGSSDDTTAIGNAITALGGEGGKVQLPSGQIRMNLTITANNVQLLGTRSTTHGTKATTIILPFDAAQPALTLGADDATILTGGVLVEDLSFYGEEADLTGIKILGGVFESTVSRCGVSNFVTGINFVGPSNQQSSLIRFINCAIVPRSNGISTSGDRCIKATQAPAYPTIYLTGIYFTSCHIQGPNSGYALETDSVEFYFTDTYIDAIGSHCIKINQSQVVPHAWLNLINTNLDSGSATGVAVVLPAPSTTKPSAYIRGTNFSVSQKVELSDGTRILYGAGPNLVYPYVQGAQGFQDTVWDDKRYYTQGYYDADYSNTVTVNPTTDILTATGDGFGTNDVVQLTSSGTLPGNYVAGLPLFVINVSGSTFQLSTSRGGSAFDFSSSGTGTITAKFTIPVRAYASAGKLVHEAVNGSQFMSPIGGTHTFQSSLIGGQVFLQLSDLVNNKSAFAWSSNGNIFLAPGTGGDVYFQDDGFSNIGGAARAKQTVWGLNLGAGTSNPAAYAVLEMVSTGKGFLPPRMTTAQRNAMTTAYGLGMGVAGGLTIFNMDTQKFNFWDQTAGAWVAFP